MDNVKFGKFIRESRKEKKLTQKQLADLLHVSDKAVSKWENGIGFPDIKLLEPLAECLDVSILELMQSERTAQKQIDREEAEQIVSDTITQSERLKEEKRQMWKVKVLLGASACGIVYLAWSGIRYLLSQNGGNTPELISAVESQSWYKNPVTFYIWIGLLVLLCGAAAIYMLWTSERISDIKIGRHKVKSILTILMDVLVVMLLHTYMANITNNQEQLLSLPDAIPINAYLSNINGTYQAGLDIKDKVVQGLQDSEYVKDLKLSVQLKSGFEKVLPGDWTHLNLFMMGINTIEVVNGREPLEVIWNMGEDSSVFEGTEAKCVVSRQLFEKKGWKLGDRIVLDQYHYYRGGISNLELFMDPLETVTYEIAGYADMLNTKDTGYVPDILVPFQTVRDSFYRKGIPFYADSASFTVANSLELNEFKQEMKDLGLSGVSPTSTESSYDGKALSVNDSAFISSANHLRQMIDTVRAFFPFLLFLIVCVGYLITLLLLQSRKNEMALLRSIGLNRPQCFRVFFTEQLVLVITGVSVGSMLSVLLQGNYGASSVLTGCLVGICYMLGNSLALWKLLNVSVMEALFRAD